jgi:hypothetical protein
MNKKNSDGSSAAMLFLMSTSRFFDEGNPPQSADVAAGSPNLSDASPEAPEKWFRAAKYQRHDLLQELAGEGFNLDSFGGRGMTALMIAADNGDEESVKVLIKLSVGLNLRDNFFGKTAMALAASKGHFKIVKCLCEADAFLDEKDYHRRTPLMESCCNGHDKCVRLLARRQASLDAKDAGGMTPAMLAADSNHVDCLQLLAEHGAQLLVKGKTVKNALHKIELLSSYDAAFSIVSGLKWNEAVMKGPDGMCDAIKRAESSQHDDNYYIAGLHFMLWYEDSWEIPQVRDEKFLVALLNCVEVFLEKSKDRSLSNRGKKALSWALEAGIIKALDGGRALALKELNRDVLAVLEQDLNDRQAQLQIVSELTDGVDTYFTRRDRFEKQVSGKLDQRDAMPEFTWKWLEELPQDVFERLQIAYKTFCDMEVIYPTPAHFSSYLRDNDLLSDDTFYSKVGAHLLVEYAPEVEEKFEAFMEEHFGQKFHGAPIKKLPRIFTKMTEDEPRLADEAQAAENPNVRVAFFQLGDAVRGAIKGDGPDDMVAVIQQLQSLKRMGKHGKFEVWRIKNTHHHDASEITGGYRDVKAIGRFTARRKRHGVDAAMIVEVQVIDTHYMDIKKYMHKAYAIERGDFDARQSSTTPSPKSKVSPPDSNRSRRRT